MTMQKTKRAMFSGVLFWSLLATVTHAAWWQWDGGAGDGDWQKPSNWNPDGANNNFNGTFSDRLNVNGAQELIYTAAEGTTLYGTSSLRGLAVGLTTSGTLTLAGGTFSTLNSGQEDAIGAYDNSTGILNISGGVFIGSSVGTTLGWHTTGIGMVSTLNVNSGSATLASLILKSVNATVSLNGGTLAVNSISRPSGGSGTLNLNGGTLKARATLSTFVSGLTAVNVLAGGAVIDTDGKNVTIANALLDGGGNGGLTKLGSGTLTLSGNSTFTGDVYVQGPGQLALAAGSAAGTGVIRLQSTQSSTGVTLAIHGGITVTNAIVMDSTTGRESIRFSGDGNGVKNGGMTITGDSNNALIIESTKTSGTATWNGDITGVAYKGSVSLRGNAGQTGYFNGKITLPSNLDHNGGGNWVVNAAGSDYVVTRFYNHGNIILGADNALDTSARVLWNDNTRNGDLDLNGFNASVAGLDRPDTSSDPLVTNNGGAASILTLAALEADRSFAGRITDGATKSVSLVMNSAGRTQTLSGTNTYSGATLVSNGTLRLTQAQCLSTNTAVTIDGGVLNLDFTGTNTVRSLQVGNVVKYKGVYGASRVPDALTGTGFLRVLEPSPPGTFVSFF